MKTLWQDVKYGARMLWKNPAFTVVAIVALALGIGANTAIFSVVNAALLRSLPYQSPDQIVMVWATNARQGVGEESLSAPNFTDLGEQSGSFERLAAFRNQSFNLTGGGEPDRLDGVFVSADFFDVLGVDAARGRTFRPAQDKPGADRVVVVSHGLWQRRFGSDPDLIGKTLTLNGEDFTAIGIMPSDFKFPEEDSELWALSKRALPEFPIKIPGVDDPMLLRGAGYLKVVARLKPGVAPARAQAETETIARRLQQYEDNEDLGLKLVPLREQIVGDSRLALLVLLGAVGFVLLIACANVANLLLARATARRKEVAIRIALGATRWRLMRQLLTESVLLGIVGGAAGLLLALWGVDSLAAVIGDDVPLARGAGFDVTVLLFTLGVSVLTGVLFGFAPALQASRPNLNETLKDAGRTSTAGFRHNRVRGLLVVSEVALALVLLVGAGLMMKSFVRLQDVDPGFNAANALTFGFWLPDFRYPEPQQQARFYQQVLERIEQLPGVQASGAISVLPLTGGSVNGSFDIEGRPEPAEERVAELRAVSPNYFRAMRIPTPEGREVTARDTAGAPTVVVINETLARRYFPGEDALGKRLAFGDTDEPAWREIVGVVGDVKGGGLSAETKPEMYVPYLQYPSAFMSVVVRGTPDPTSLTAAIRREVASVDKEQPVLNVRLMQQLVTESIAPQRSNMLLLGVFAAVALALAAVGIFGVMSYMVTQRTHEIGIRMALGAQTGDVLRLVVRQGLTLALCGVGLGLAGAFAVTRVLASLLYGVSTTDPMIFVGVSLLLATVALVACYLPARRAMKVDPMVALRYE